MNKAQKGQELMLTLHNINISYDDVGEGELTVIFLHGFPFDKSMWHSQVSFLEKSYRCIAMDIRGFGKSINSEANSSIDIFSDDVIQLMDQLHIKEAVVCGLSMGGYIALNFSSRYSDRIKALILCDTQCIADSDAAREKRHKSIEEILKDGHDNFVDKFIKSIFCQNTHNTKPEIVSQLKTLVSANPIPVFINGLKALANRTETCTKLTDIVIPTLIVCGQEDELTPVSQSEFMHQQIKGSMLHVIENAGHMSNLEQEDEFNKILLNFLSALDSQNTRM